MPRALTIIITFHWAAMLGVGAWWGLQAAFAGASVAKIAASTTVIALQFVAALAFFWALVSVLMRSDSEAAGQGDVCRIAIGAGLVATTVAALAVSGDRADLQAHALQFAGLLVSHLIMQAERPAVKSLIGANDNSRAAARLLAMLAATDAKISRMTGMGGQGERRR